MEERENDSKASKKRDFGSVALQRAGCGIDVLEQRDNFVMLMCNHGSITCGQTIQEAMFYTYHLEQACKTQCLTLAMNRELSIPSEEICSKAVKDLLSFEGNLGERDWHAWVRLIKGKL